MNTAQNLSQEKIFLAISYARLSERQFAAVLMHHVALSVFGGKKEARTPSEVGSFNT